MAANSDVMKKGVAQIIEFARANIDQISPAVKQRLSQFLSDYSEKISQVEPQPIQAIDPEIPDSARLLWVASGGNPSVFAQYLGSYPDPTLAKLQRDPQRMIAMIKALMVEIPKGQIESAEGIKASWLPSSNVYGFKYLPNSKKMYVKFNGKDVKSGGSTYMYNNVPPEVAKIVSMGSIPAKTSGRNKHGSWWKGKAPSIAASVNQMLVKGGFPYQKISA